MSDHIIIKNIKFVKEIEKHPCLYDYGHMHYARRDITEKAWNDVGKRSNLAGSQCKEKWKNFRTVLARYLKPSRKRKRPYYLAEAMQFAVPFIKTQSTALSRPYDQDPMSDLTHENDEDLIEVSFPKNSPLSSYTISPPHNFPSAPCSPETCIVPIPSPQRSPTPERNTQDFKRAVISKHITNDIDAFKPLNCKDTQELKLEGSDNSINTSRKMFLLSLLPDVYSMTDVQMRSFRIKVLTLIDEIVQP